MKYWLIAVSSAVRTSFRTSMTSASPFITSLLGEPPDVFVHLVLPVGPIVPAVRPPVVHRVRDPLGAQDLGQPPGRPAVLVRAVARGQADVALREALQVPRVAQARDVVHGVVEVEVVVVVPIHELADVVDAGEGEAA